MTIRVYGCGARQQQSVGIFPPYPLKEELSRDRDYKVTQAADYIAVTSGKAYFRGG